MGGYIVQGTHACMHTHMYTHNIFTVIRDMECNRIYIGTDKVSNEQQK